MYTVSLDYGLKLRQIKIISVAVHQGNTNIHTHTYTNGKIYQPSDVMAKYQRPSE